MQLLVFATLCFTTWMSSVQATPGRLANCCIQWSTTKIPLHLVMNYTIQSEGVCPISAVRFHTNRGKTICSDPDSKWAKRVIEKVDRKTRTLLEKGQSEEGSTSDMTPVACTLPKNEPRQKIRKGRRRLRKQRRRGKKVQKKDMHLSLVLVTVLCFTTWVSSAHATHGPTASTCCVQWSTTRVQLNKIISYTIQSEGVCRIFAVQFLTVSGKTICSNPNTDWTKKAISKVDEERRVASTAITPTASTLPKTTTGHSPTITQKWNETTEQTQQASEKKATKSCSAS
ncbi:uncharacterized protein LOC114449677 [Parambassis ranga]|uniref:Uncharacterized protein LOC114449677 n=1 Tax=Parambassis ranga TaxID=210632 RepID=A0A6P7K1Z4_9TELE|nr:uncharacterized protein LOC114449677 [Parambassis ranga]